MPKFSEASPEIEKLYPDLSEEDRIELEENLCRYLAVVKNIYEHVSVNNPKILTKLRKNASLRKSKKALK